MRKSLLGAAVLGLLLSGCGIVQTTSHAHMKMGIATNATVIASPRVRTYYIAADEVLWDYAPDDRNDITGRAVQRRARRCSSRTARPGSGTSTASRSTAPTPTPRFTHRIPAPTSCPARRRSLRRHARHDRAGDPGRGRATRSRWCSATTRRTRPRSTRTACSTRRTPRVRRTPTAPRARPRTTTPWRRATTYTYIWEVPERAGPGPMDGSSVMWMYHSHTDEVADTNAGLVGPMVITAKGKADPATATPTDVDREIFSYFTVENENASPYLDHNLQRAGPGAARASPADDEDGFEESNLMHSINGYVYGNGPVPTVIEGRSARALVHLHARHRGRPAHAALARQHRDHQRDAHRHDPARCPE